MSRSLKMIRFLFSAVVLACTATAVDSQDLVNPQKSKEEIFLARTKQLNEFIDRFNLRSDFRGNNPDSAFLSKMPREKMLAALFDRKDPRSISGSADYSSEYSALRNAFIDVVSREKLLINKFSPNIIAEAVAKVTYKGQPATLRLFMNQEQTGNGGVKWVLLSAGGELFKVFSEDTSMVRFIPPSSHENDFINLKRALDDTDHLPAYAAVGFRQDNLSVFFFCIKSGITRFEYVEKVIYHIIDIPGWYFRIEDFNRNELNSGWLISDLRQNDLKLSDFLKNL